MCFYFSHLTCTFHFNCCLNKIFVIVIIIVIVTPKSTSKLRSALHISYSIVIPRFISLLTTTTMFIVTAVPAIGHIIRY